MRVLVLFEGFHSVDDDIANATSHIKSKETCQLITRNASKQCYVLFCWNNKTVYVCLD